MKTLRQLRRVYREGGWRETVYRGLRFLANRIRRYDDERFHDIRRYISTDSPVIVDGGAHRGETIRGFLNAYPAAEIHAFEPNPELVDGLKQEFDGDKVSVYAKALGAENGTEVFNVSTASPESSLRSSSPEVEHRHGGDIDREVPVDIVRLDEVLSGPIDILKLDLQGYELEALRGATGLLDQTKLILTEVEYLPNYAGAATFCELNDFLTKRDFQLHDLYVHYRSWGPAGRLEWGDALYLNHESFSWSSASDDRTHYDPMGKHYAFNSISWVEHSYTKPVYE